MDTSNPAADSNDQRPADQQARAAQAHPNPRDPQSQPGSSPAFGSFGHAHPTNSGGPAPVANDGSNDNPDEFSEFRKSSAPATEDYSTEAEQANPAQQPGHVEQNQAPAEVAATQNADQSTAERSWADDDPRYAGGHQRQAYDDDPTHVL